MIEVAHHDVDRALDVGDRQASQAAVDGRRRRDDALDGGAHDLLVLVHGAHHLGVVGGHLFGRGHAARIVQGVVLGAEPAALAQHLQRGGQHPSRPRRRAGSGCTR